MRACGVGTVCAVGNDNLGSLSVLAACVISFDKHDARKLTVRACRRLKSHGVHTCNFAKSVGKSIHQLGATLNRRLVLQGVDFRKPVETADFFVDTGVVLHRATAQRIKTVVYAVSLFGQRGIMTNDVYFRNLGQTSFLLAFFRFKRVSRNVQLVEGDSRATLLGFFKNQHIIYPP